MTSSSITSFTPINTAVTIYGDPHGKIDSLYVKLGEDDTIRITGHDTEWMMTLALQIQSTVLGYRIRVEKAADDCHYVECDHIEAKTVIAEHSLESSKIEHEDSEMVTLSMETPTAESIAEADSIAVKSRFPTVEHDRMVAWMIRDGWARSAASPKYGTTWLYRVENGVTRYTHVPHFYRGR